MTNRREFMQTGLMLSAASAALTAPLSGVADAAKVAPPALSHFVFDNRYAEAVAMARSFRRSAPLAETNGDLTDLWLNHLNPQWKRAPQALAGVTTAQGLFVLETLAADHRMRVVYRGEPGGLQFARALAQYAAGARRTPQRADHFVEHDRPLVAWIIAPRATSA